MVGIVDYDLKQHLGYHVGRGLLPSGKILWAETFARCVPGARPLTSLDLGSGTGRFSAILAETFGGPVYAVEPSAKMRAVAMENERHPGVTLLEGRAEAIPLRDACCDVILMFLSFHHFKDRQQAAYEVGRVLAPGGRLLIRTGFSDRMPDLDFHRFFPRSRDLEREMFPSTAEVEQLFRSVGISKRELITVKETLAEGLADHAERLRTMSISTFEFLDGAEIEEGFRQLEAAVALDDGSPIIADCDLLILGRD